MYSDGGAFDACPHQTMDAEINLLSTARYLELTYGKQGLTRNNRYILVKYHTIAALPSIFYHWIAMYMPIYISESCNYNLYNIKSITSYYLYVIILL
jgi:hypothetical protein